MLTKSELLRDASNKLCREARIERAEAERVRAAAKEARESSQGVSSLSILINPFPSHLRAEQLSFSRRLESFLCRQPVWPGGVLATNFDTGGEHCLGR
jgi:hypothetical protein